ncbi:MAG: hypothetical protein EU531_02250 [Promethearchaeota archaeon]|nr:MAG: hypothetical protein EU531_02250 [Candidatus Lokiarchaeota archaeon]
MEFNTRQYDGPYEVSAVELDIEGQLLRGLLYFPRESYPKPYPLITYFHDFPQLFSLHQIVSNLEFLLEMGFSLLVFNFRGYRQSQGEVSLQSQLQDALEMAKFIQLMGKKEIFKLKEVNILAHGFGSYIALLLSSMINFLNKILLISPILNVKKQIDDDTFVKTLAYINRYLPGYIHGIENTDLFLSKTKSELNCEEYRLERVFNKMTYNKMKIIIGSRNKLIDISELKASIFDKLPRLKVVLIEQMDHDWMDEENIGNLQEEIKLFLAY